jgi:hypothetical protein
MFRLRRLIYFLASLAGATYCSYEFFARAKLGTTGTLAAVDNLLFIGVMLWFVRSEMFFVEFVSGKPMAWWNSYWLSIDDRPWLKLCLSLMGFVLFVVLLGIPVVIGGVLAR